MGKFTELLTDLKLVEAVKVEPPIPAELARVPEDIYREAAAVILAAETRVDQTPQVG